MKIFPFTVHPHFFGHQTLLIQCLKYSQNFSTPRLSHCWYPCLILIILALFWSAESKAMCSSPLGSGLPLMPCWWCLSPACHPLRVPGSLLEKIWTPQHSIWDPAPTHLHSLIYHQSPYPSTITNKYVDWTPLPPPYVTYASPSLWIFPLCFYQCFSSLGLFFSRNNYYLAPCP